MSTATTSPLHNRQLSGLAVTLAVHLALVWLWQCAGKPQAVAETSARRIQWIDIALLKPAVKTEPAIKSAPTSKLTPERPTATPARSERQVVRPTVPTSVPPSTVAPEPAVATVPAHEAPPGRSTDEILRLARKDMGAISKELQKEFPTQKITAPPDTAQLRLQRGIEHAAEMAPPQWFEAPKVSELVAPGSGDKRRYRVITANGTYCVTTRSNRTWDAMDAKPTGGITNCWPAEQPAKKQKYESRHPNAITAAD